MLNKVRKFLHNHSPDWLNTEVNKDLLHNLSTKIASTPKTKNIDSAPLLKDIDIAPLNTGGWEDRPLLTAKKTPHWRRINQVFQTLDTAPPSASYTQLIEYVRLSTGQGCSRKLISKWKKQNTSHKFPDNNSGDERNLEKSTAALSISQTIVNIPSNNKSLMTVKAWTYLTAAVGAIAILGCEVLPLNNNRLTENIVLAEVTTPLTSSPITPETRKNRLEPRNIKISLTLDTPQDLKVKPGDKVSAGQTLSDRASERNRLQAKKQQLQLALQKLNLPLFPIPKPKPIPEISPLPPVSYDREEAAIKLKQQNLEEANRAIAVQQKKIDSIEREIPPLLRGARGDRDLQLILSHERANLKNLESAQQQAQIQLELAQSQLTTAKENRAYAEDRRQLEQTQREIAISQQTLETQRREAERDRQLAEQQYSQAQISAQITEINEHIAQLSTVKAPYEGTIEKIKWTGQSDNTLTVELTLAVNDDRPTTATAQQRENRETEARDK
jgi:biotin carboxyl carrier protein